jgi:hypothetical protein
LASNGPSPVMPVPGETPTSASELEIRISPARPWRAAKRRVPTARAHNLTAFAVLGSVVAGVAGAVITLRIGAGLTGPAYAELALTFTAAVLIATRPTSAASEQPPPSAAAAGHDRAENDGLGGVDGR